MHVKFSCVSGFLQGAGLRGEGRGLKGRAGSEGASGKVSTLREALFRFCCYMALDLKFKCLFLVSSKVRKQKKRGKGKAHGVFHVSTVAWLASNSFDGDGRLTVLSSLRNRLQQFCLDIHKFVDLRAEFTQKKSQVISCGKKLQPLHRGEGYGLSYMTYQSHFML